MLHAFVIRNPNTAAPITFWPSDYSNYIKLRTEQSYGPENHPREAMTMLLYFKKNPHWYMITKSVHEHTGQN